MDNLRAYHPNPYYRIDKDDFDALVEEQHQAISPPRSSLECLAAIMKVVGSVRDGHCLIVPLGEFSLNLWLPVRVYCFSDGCFIISASEQYQDLIGKELLSINGISISQIETLLNPFIPSDNDCGRKNSFPYYLANANFLKAVGIVKEDYQISLGTKDSVGEQQVFSVETFYKECSLHEYKRTFLFPGMPGWSHPFRSAIPEYLRAFYSEYQYYWSRYDPIRKSMYLQINQIVDSPDQYFQDFMNRFWGDFDSHSNDMKTFVLDLRFNPGGNGKFCLNFVKAIIQREASFKHIRFSVLVGRQTFSAAIILVAQLVNYTNAILVGEPMGGPLHMFTTALQMGSVPSGRFEFHVPTEEFFFKLPTDQSFLFPPHIPVPISSTDFFSGEDKTLNTALDPDIITRRVNLKNEMIRNGSNINQIKTITQAFSENLLETENIISLAKKVKQINVDWGVHQNECSFYAYDHQFTEWTLKLDLAIVARNYASKNMPEYAEALFDLAAILYPDYCDGWFHFGEFLRQTGDNERARLCYGKCLDLNADHPLALDRIENQRGL